MIIGISFLSLNSCAVPQNEVDSTWIRSVGTFTMMPYTILHGARLDAFWSKDTHTSLSVLFKVVNYFSFRIYSAIQCKEFRVAATGTRRFTIVTTGAPYSSLDWHFNRISVSYNGTQLVARSVYMCVWSVCIELRYSPHLFRSIIILLYFVVGFFCFNDGSCRRKIKVKHFSGTV